MSVLVVLDPLVTLDPRVDATVGLMAATEALEHDVWVCGANDLSVVDGRVLARAERTVLRPRRRGRDHRWMVDPVWYDLREAAVLDVVADVDLVLMRLDPPVDERYLRTTYLLDLVEAGGVRVVNRPEGIRALHEKLGTLLLPHLCPPTLVSADPREVREFVAAHGAVVLKPVDGFAGTDVWLVHDDRGARALVESATRGGARHVIAQAYLAEVEEGNKRLFVLDGEVVGAVLRRATAQDFRIGPPVAEAEVTHADRRIVAELAPTLRRHGIALAGLDVIGDRLIEVNVTCPGGMAKTDALLGTDLSGVVVRRLLDRTAAPRTHALLHPTA